MSKECNNMKYTYLNNKLARNEAKKECEKIIKSLQKVLNEYFTFSFELIGSGKTNIITVDKKSNSFDLDYNIIIQKDKKNLIHNPKKIKELFLSKMNEINCKFKFDFPCNSKSVITSSRKPIKCYNFSFDIAILIEGNNGNYMKIIYDKHNDNNYKWNEIKNSNQYQQLYSIIKQNHYVEFKRIYLEKKNSNTNKVSFSLFLETINELYDKYEK